MVSLLVSDSPWSNGSMEPQYCCIHSLIRGR